MNDHKLNNTQKNNEKQAGPELCQAQVTLGLAEIEIFFHLIEYLGRLEVVFHLPKKLRSSSICLKT